MTTQFYELQINQLNFRVLIFNVTYYINFMIFHLLNTLAIDILTKKLSLYGFSDSARAWFSSFLTGRSQRVRIGGCVSQVAHLNFLLATLHHMSMIPIIIIKALVLKFRQSGVPTGDLLLRRILKVCALSRVEARF